MRVKDFFNEMNCKKSLLFNTVYGRRHSKLFTNCHVLWDTLYHKKMSWNIKIKMVADYADVDPWVYEYSTKVYEFTA